MPFGAPLIVRLTDLSRRNGNSLWGPRLSASFPNGARNSPGPIWPSVSIVRLSNAHWNPSEPVSCLSLSLQTALRPEGAKPPETTGAEGARSPNPKTFSIFPRFRPCLSWLTSPGLRRDLRMPGRALQDDPDVLHSCNILLKKADIVFFIRDC
jgi:hypothetical protein